MSEKTKTARLPLGTVKASPEVSGMMRGMVQFDEFVRACVARHQAGDWGDVDIFHKAANDAAVKAGERVLSIYRWPQSLGGRGVLWVLTEADRSATTVLQPSEAEFKRGGK